MSDKTLISNQGVTDWTVTTDADLSALQYHFVKFDTAENLVACGAAASLGILQNAPDGSSVEASATVRMQGMSKLSLAETVAFGDRLTSTAASKGEVVDAAGEEIGARALSSGESGDLISVQLMFGKAVSSDA